MSGRRTTERRNVGGRLLCRLIIHWCCPRWRDRAGLMDILAPHFGVFIRCGKVDRGVASQNRLLKEPFQIRPTPTAAGSRAVAIRELRGAARFFDADVVENLPLRHMKAEAKFVVGGHVVSLVLRSSRQL